MKSRKQQALDVRIAAAKLAFDRPHPPQQPNDDESRHFFDGTDPARGSKPSYLANYTKGLPHSEVDGLICSSDDYQLFVEGVNSGDPDDFKATPLGPKGSTAAPVQWKSTYTQRHDVEVRAWESAGAGLTFDLEGPDAQAVAMPPAPTIGSDELAAEVAEVYEMALLRDIPFSEFDTSSKVAASIERLNKLKWFKNENLPGISAAAAERQRGEIDSQNAFRGTTFRLCILRTARVMPQSQVPASLSSKPFLITATCCQSPMSRRVPTVRNYSRFPIRDLA